MNTVLLTERFVSPTTFIVRDFAGDLVIDWRNPGKNTDLGALRQDFFARVPSLIDMDPDSLFGEVNQMLLEFGAVTEAGDLVESLSAFTREIELKNQIAVLGQELLSDPTASAFAVAKAILELMGVLREPQHFPCLLQCHTRGVTHLEQGGTHFFYVLDGQAHLLFNGWKHSLYPGMYGAVPGEAIVEGEASVEIITRFDFHGMYQIGGPIEEWGRLNYIDGCTDSLLVHPVKKGAACLNALFFPPGVAQTSHTHPSLRCGIVVKGSGRCLTPTVEYELSVGKVFFLPPETWHSFHTEQEPLVVIAFHPDSDTGPSDQDHPMLNRTFFRVKHVLDSFRRTSSGSV